MKLSGELVEEPKKRWRPVPIYDSGGIDVSKPYLRKDILKEIGNNLNELAELKTGNKQPEIPKKEQKPMTFEPEDIEVKPKDVKISEVIIPEVKSEPKLETPNFQITKPEIKPEVKIEIIKPATENNKKIIKKKVKRMNDSDEYNVSPEMRQMQRERDFDEIARRKALESNVNEMVRINKENSKKLEQIESKYGETSNVLKNDIKSDLELKLKNLEDKFGKVNEHLGHVHEKLEKTCTGIECLTNDFKKFEENKVEFAECDSCHDKNVPPKSSFCPGCGKKLSWFEDDGVTPLKGWTPAWKKFEQ
jgi:hypothetical protein